MMLPLLLACASAPEARFDRDAILGRVLARVDTDKDGTVTAEEYARVDFSGPTFAEADTDADGALGVAELRTMTFAQDPTTFYRAPDLVLTSGRTIPGSGGNANAVKHDGPTKGGAQGGAGGKKGGDRMQPSTSLFVLRILHAEVASVDPTIPLPSEEEMARIGFANTLESEEAVALLRALEEAAAKANVGFPATLRASTRASRSADPAKIPATTAADR